MKNSALELLIICKLEGNPFGWCCTVFMANENDNLYKKF